MHSLLGFGFRARVVRALGFVMLLVTAKIALSYPLPSSIRVEKLQSQKLGEVREVWISLPDDYETSHKRYPVVYLLDGESNFTSGVIGSVRHAAMLGQIPEFLLVAIPNTNRSKDIFPEEIVYPDGTRDGGRANDFLNFLHDELIPHIAQSYRTSGFRVLYGTSNTAFTAVYGMFRSPDLADAFLAASATLAIPSFQSTQEKQVHDFHGGKRQLVLVMGESDLPTVLSLNGQLKEVIDRFAPSGLSCRLKVMEKAGHVPPDALLEGLRAVVYPADVP